MRAYERRATFRAGANLRTWLLSILHNTFVDGRRQREAELRREAETSHLAEITAPPIRRAVSASSRSAERS